MGEEKSERNTWQVLLALILLGPPWILFSLMGFDFIDAVPLNPYKFAFNADYRQQAKARWQRTNSMWREIGNLLAILIMVVVTLCFYYAIYTGIRYHTVPDWMQRTYCFLASCN